MKYLITAALGLLFVAPCVDAQASSSGPHAIDAWHFGFLDGVAGNETIFVDLHPDPYFSIWGVDVDADGDVDVVFWPGLGWSRADPPIEYASGGGSTVYTYKVEHVSYDGVLTARGYDGGTTSESIYMVTADVDGDGSEDIVLWAPGLIRPAMIH